METDFWFVESFQLNLGGKNSLCCVTTVSICLFFDLWLKKTTSKIYLFQFRLFSVLQAAFETTLKICKPNFWSSQSRLLEGPHEAGLVKFSYLEANLSNLMALSLGPLSH